MAPILAILALQIATLALALLLARRVLRRRPATFADRFIDFVDALRPLMTAAGQWAVSSVGVEGRQQLEHVVREEAAETRRAVTVAIWAALADTPPTDSNTDIPA